MRIPVYYAAAIAAPIIYTLIVVSGIAMLSNLQKAKRAIPPLLILMMVQILLWLCHAYISTNYPAYRHPVYIAIAPLSPVATYLILVRGHYFQVQWQIFEYTRVIVLGALLPGLLYLLIPTLLE